MGKKRVKITEDNLSWGITALAVICLSIAFYLIMTQMPSLKKHIGTVLNVLMRVIKFLNQFCQTLPGFFPVPIMPELQNCLFLPFGFFNRRTGHQSCHTA